MASRISYGAAACSTQIHLWMHPARVATVRPYRREATLRSALAWELLLRVPWRVFYETGKVWRFRRILGQKLLNGGGKPCPAGEERRAEPLLSCGDIGVGLGGRAIDERPFRASLSGR